MPVLHRTVFFFMSDLLNSKSFRLFWNRLHKRELDNSKLQSVMTIDNYISGAKLKPFFSHTLSFLSTFIIIICIELHFFWRNTCFLILVILISLFKTFYFSESESGTQIACSYVFWAVFAVSRYIVNSCNRFIVKEEDSQSFSLICLLSWL